MDLSDEHSQQPGPESSIVIVTHGTSCAARAVVQRQLALQRRNTTR
jgi:hypothetical protein